MSQPKITSDQIDTGSAAGQVLSSAADGSVTIPGALRLSNTAPTTSTPFIANNADFAIYSMSVITTNATPALATINGIANALLKLSANSGFGFRIHGACKNITTPPGVEYFIADGCIQMGATASTTTFVSTPTIRAYPNNSSAPNIALIADTTNGALSIQVTGVAATTYHWIFTVQILIAI
jgi:hypothetical protein